MKDKSEINRIITRLELCQQDVLTILSEHDGFRKHKIKRKCWLEQDVAHSNLTKVLSAPEGIDGLKASLHEYTTQMAIN